MTKDLILTILPGMIRAPNGFSSTPKSTQTPRYVSGILATLDHGHRHDQSEHQSAPLQDPCPVAKTVADSATARRGAPGLDVLERTHPHRQIERKRESEREREIERELKREELERVAQSQGERTSEFVGGRRKLRELVLEVGGLFEDGRGVVGCWVSNRVQKGTGDLSAFFSAWSDRTQQQQQLLRARRSGDETNKEHDD